MFRNVLCARLCVSRYQPLSIGTPAWPARARPIFPTRTIKSELIPARLSRLQYLFGLFHQIARHMKRMTDPKAQIQHHGCRCPNNPCLWPFASPLISHLQHHTKLQKLKNNQRSYSTHLRAFTKASNPRYMSSFRANKSKHAFRVDNPQDSTRSGPCLGLRLARIMRCTLHEKIGNGTRGQVQQ
jgi:hypothetical protein